MKSADTTKSVNALSMKKERSISEKKAPLVRVKERNKICSCLQKTGSALGDKTYFSLYL